MSDQEINGVKIKVFQETQTICITDLWKASGKPSYYRPDKWAKSDQIQEYLESLALALPDAVTRNKSGKISNFVGVYEVIRGGNRDFQGTYTNFHLASQYVECLSNEVKNWFLINVLGEKDDDVIEAEVEDTENDLSIIGSEEFYENVRITSDGRISVYDGIRFTTGHKNPWQVWNDHLELFPVFLHKTEEYKFPLRGGAGRSTPVATLQVFLEIVTTLPGSIASMIREKAVSVLIRAMNGDPTLIDEILDRVTDKTQLFDLQEAINERINNAFTGDNPVGTVQNPIEIITPELKATFIWINKVNEMTTLLGELASHVGNMVISRDNPHRPYSKSGKAKSRIIPLTLRSIEKISVLHVYQFKSDYIDDQDVVEFFSQRAYPEIAYRDKDNTIKCVVVHIVAPGGITKDALQRLNDIQYSLDMKYGKGVIKLDAMRLDELVWGEMYPKIKERYKDDDGCYGWHNLNKTVTSKCKKLCAKPEPKNELLQPTLFDFYPSMNEFL